MTRSNGIWGIMIQNEWALDFAERKQSRKLNLRLVGLIGNSSTEIDGQGMLIVELFWCNMYVRKALK